LNESRVDENAFVSTSIIINKLKLVNNKENVHGGKIASSINQWIEITSDKYILDIVRGYSIQFADIPHQQKIPKPLQFSNSEIIMANECIETFLEKKIIEVSKNQLSASSFVVIGLPRAL
jgi:hypothetical protein